jgi:hypothetical protein
MGHFFLAGKKLRVIISFNYNYVENSPPSSRTDKGGCSSTTQRMLTQKGDYSWMQNKNSLGAIYLARRIQAYAVPWFPLCSGSLLLA